MARAHPRTNRDTADDDADDDNVSGDGDKRDDKHDDDHDDDDGGSDGDDSDEDDDDDDDDDTVFRLRFVCCSRLETQRAFIDLGGAAPRKKGSSLSSSGCPRSNY